MNDIPVITILNEREQNSILIHREKMLEQLTNLRGAKLSVLLSYWLYRADGIHPTTLDISESTGYTPQTVTRIYSRMIDEKIIPPPICEKCEEAIPPGKFHRHHVIPGKDKYINICITCHLRIKPR